MRAFFQEPKTNERRRTAPKRGRRPIRFLRQAPALGRPHGIDHIRAPSTPTRGLAALLALPRPTAHHGRRPSGTRHPNPRPRTNQQQRPRPHANKDLRPQHRPHTGPDRPHTPPSQRLHHRPHDISHDVAARGTTTRRTGTTASPHESNDGAVELAPKRPTRGSGGRTRRRRTDLGAEPDRSRAGTEPISAIAPRGGRPALAPRAGGRGRQRRCQPRPPAPDPLRAQAS